VSKPDREPKPEFSVCGCTGWGKPGTGGYSLRHVIAALDRMNGQPASAEVKPEPEGGRSWMWQGPDRPDFP
jgi:hypothetical protein